MTTKFNTTLFKLLNHDAILVIDDYEVEGVSDYGDTADGATVLCCECDEEHAWYFTDQPVAVENGHCNAVTVSGEWTGDDEPVTVNLGIWVTRYIQESDLP